MGVLFLKQPLANLEDEIFLKGGSVVTPQNFDLVLLIKFFARKINFYLLDLSLDFRTSLFFDTVKILPQVKTFQKYYWTCIPSQENISFISGFICIIFFPELF